MSASYKWLDSENLNLTYERLVDVERDFAIFTNVVVPAQVGQIQRVRAVEVLQVVGLAQEIEPGPATIEQR